MGAQGAETQPTSWSLLSLTPRPPHGPNDALPAIFILGPSALPTQTTSRAARPHLPHTGHSPPSGTECQSPQRSPLRPSGQPPTSVWVPQAWGSCVLTPEWPQNPCPREGEPGPSPQQSRSGKGLPPWSCVVRHVPGPGLRCNHCPGALRLSGARKQTHVDVGTVDPHLLQALLGDPLLLRPPGLRGRTWHGALRSLPRPWSCCALGSPVPRPERRTESPVQGSSPGPDSQERGSPDGGDTGLLPLSGHRMPLSGPSGPSPVSEGCGHPPFRPGQAPGARQGPLGSPPPPHPLPTGAFVPGQDAPGWPLAPDCLLQGQLGRLRETEMPDPGPSTGGC